MKATAHPKFAFVVTCLAVITLLAGCVTAGPGAPQASSGNPADINQIPPRTLPALQAQGGAVIGPTAVYSGLSPKEDAPFNGLNAAAGKGTRTPKAPTATPTSAGAAFTDDFSSATKGGWALGKTTGGNSYIKNGMLTIEITKDNYTVWTYRKNQTADDFVIDVDATQGEEGAMLGIIARIASNDDDTSSFYFFGIDADGNYLAYLYDAGEWSALVNPKRSSAIDTEPGATNHLQLIAQGSEFTFLVNDKQVVRVEDETVSSGLYGLIASAEYAGSSGSFDNFSIGGVEDTPATPEPGATRTPQPGATRTPRPSADVIFSDDFSTTEGGWKLKDTSSYSSDIVDEQLQIAVKKAMVLAWATNGQSASDYALDVDVSHIDGEPDGEAGVILRLGPAGNDDMQFYLFGISPVGAYYMVLYDAGEWTTLIEPTVSEAVLTDEGAVNHLRVVAKGDTFTLFINGEEVNEVTDETISEGLYALYAGSGQSGPFTAAFDNLVLTEVK